jgi:hypothetical protein
MINSNHKSIEEENIPFGIHPSKDHSHSLAPYAPAFLAGATGRKKRVPKKEGQQHLYSPPLGHFRDPPLDHPPRPRPAPITPSVRPLPLFVGHPCALRWAPIPLRWTPVRVSVCLAHPLGIAGHPRCSIRLLRRATPSGPPSHSLYKYPCLP